MKRFTESLKWEDQWFRKLKPEAKLFWFWMLDKCDQAGVLDVDFDLATFQCGVKITPAILTLFERQIQILPTGKLHILRFVQFQYGKLSRACKPHTPVFAALERHGLDENGLHPLLPERLSIPMPKAFDEFQIPYHGRVKETEKEKDKETEKEPDRRKASSLEEVANYCKELGDLYPRDASYLWNHWQENGWTNGGKAIRDWKATIRKWRDANHLPTQKQMLTSDHWPEPASTEPQPEYDENWLLKEFNKNKAKADAKQREEEGTEPALGEIEPLAEGEVF